MDRFEWHVQARLFGPDGAESAKGGADAAGPASLSARPGPASLARAMALAAAGQAFRIDPTAADAPLPGAATGPVFETLTSGTLGQPRRIRRKQRSWTTSFHINAGLFDIGPGLPLAVVGSLAQSLSLYGAIEGLCLGASVHLLDGLRPDRQRRALADRQVALLYATPAQLYALCKAAGPVLALERIVVGGAKLDAGLRRAVAVLAPDAAVTEFYGTAEASFITMAGADTPQGSVGRAFPGVDIRLIRPGGRICDDGEAGEIWVRSPLLFEGYGCAGGAGAGAARWNGGWLSVEEWGRLIDGQLYVLGRAGRMVTVADHNVFPEEIEGFLATLPGVAQAAVLPRPDSARGVTLIAVLQGDRSQEAALLAALRATLGPMKAPRAVIWVEDWPMLPSGKTDLRTLEQLL